MKRRMFLATSVGATIAGCLSEGESTDGEPDPDADDDSTANGEPSDEEDDDVESEDSAEIVIEYSTFSVSSEEVSQEVIEHPNPEEFEWVVVEFELISGSFDASDIEGLTQVKSGDTTEFTRAVIITHPDDELIQSPDDSYLMETGTQGKAYYRFSDTVNDLEWVVEQLDNQHGVETREVDVGSEEASEDEGTSKVDLIDFEEPEDLLLSRDQLDGDDWVRDDNVDPGHSHTRVLFQREADSRYEFIISEISAYEDVENAKHRKDEARTRGESQGEEMTEVDFADGGFSYEADGWASMYFRDANVVAGIMAGIGSTEWEPVEPKPDMRDSLVEPLRDSWEQG